ncbi:thiamine phosphate synthase [Geodermatophilus sp. DSM 44513]|uniref:thiamine phosphate synthase n=1 Tax=Geodermatophilus sp. DSM 44513 TaxID=1528104 RepID=UPI00126F795B|nr:thiamine phosphate synthase [Geodermatophilus sp. DSM 44513]WNV75215.1 thiamine phosphate synthase [Geodermatophilus sp. DSM 44513]
MTGRRVLAAGRTNAPIPVDPDRGAEVRRRISGLHVLTDAREGRDALAVVSAAVAAGARIVQVRVKFCPDRALYDFAARVVEVCRRRGATCLVNDRVDIALAVGAAGTHLGAGDLPVAAARSVAGPAHLLGGTARTAAAATELVAAGADYLGVGPAFSTATKPGLPDPLGVDGVAAVAEAVAVPVIAIGGITADRIPALLTAGAAGVAVVSAVSDAPDPGLATRALLAALGGAPQSRPPRPEPGPAERGRRSGPR